jgi:hypothetical protein
MNRAIAVALLVLTVSLHAQTPMPVVVPVAPAAAQQPVRVATAVDPSGSASLLNQLQQMKAANEETIRKQTALLQQLDQLQQAADQLRILAKRS